MSNGRTAGFDPAGRGSTPRAGATLEELSIGALNRLLRGRPQGPAGPTPASSASYNHGMLCACGCERQANEGKTFIHGHNVRARENFGLKYGQSPSADTLVKLRASSKAYYDSAVDHPLKVAVAERRTCLGGHRFTVEVRAKMSAAKIGNTHCVGRKYSQETISKFRGHPAPRRKNPGARFNYGGIDFRSTWEVRAAKSMDALGVEWEYEPRPFRLSTGERYTPDFYISADRCYWEVKGYYSLGARLKIETFRAEFPETPLVVLTKNGLLALEAAARTRRLALLLD